MSLSTDIYWDETICDANFFSTVKALIAQTETQKTNITRLYMVIVACVARKAKELQNENEKIRINQLSSYQKLIFSYLNV